LSVTADHSLEDIAALLRALTAVGMESS
jgi:hypothetical protein